MDPVVPSTWSAQVILAPTTGALAANVCLSGQVLLAFAWAVTLIRGSVRILVGASN